MGLAQQEWKKLQESRTPCQTLGNARVQIELARAGQHEATGPAILVDDLLQVRKEFGNRWASSNTALLGAAAETHGILGSGPEGIGVLKRDVGLVGKRHARQRRLA